MQTKVDTEREQGQWRRVCAWCKRDLGPAGPDFTGDTHGMCEACRDTVLTQWREREGK